MRRRLRPRDGAAPRPILATATKLRAPQTSSLPAIGSYTINGRRRTRWWPPIADADKVLWWRPPPAHHVRFAHPDEEPQLLWPREGAALRLYSTAAESGQRGRGATDDSEFVSVSSREMRSSLLRARFSLMTSQTISRWSKHPAREKNKRTYRSCDGWCRGLVEPLSGTCVLSSFLFLVFYYIYIYILNLNSNRVSRSKLNAQSEFQHAVQNSYYLFI
jgi:hypothetical protein